MRNSFKCEGGYDRFNTLRDEHCYSQRAFKFSYRYSSKKKTRLLRREAFKLPNPTDRMLVLGTRES